MDHKRWRTLQVTLLGLFLPLLFNSSAFAQAFFCPETPRAITAGDFNGDNKLDVALVRQEFFQGGVFTAPVFIFSGDGAGGLGTETQIPSGLVQPTSVVAGNFVSGGGLDLAVAGFTKVFFPFGTVGLSILKGDGLGGFTLSQRFILGSVLTRGTFPTVTAGDFNGDGLQDLAVVDGDARVRIFLQTSSGFVLSATSTVLFGPADIAMGNFNSNLDGNLDLAVAKRFDSDGNVSRGEVSIRFGDGAGGIAGGSTLNTGAIGPQSIVTGDFNNDGRLDLAILHFGSSFFPSNPSNEISILLGDGNGNFQAAGNPISLPAGDNGASLLALHFNGAGHLDLAAAVTGDHVDDNRVFVLFGDGAGGFATGLEFDFNDIGFPPRSIVAGDFDGDGLPDLATSFFCGTEVKILLNLLPAIDIKPGSDPNSWLCEAVNRDLPVAILSDAGFDATTVDANSVRFGKNGTEAAEVHVDRNGNKRRHVGDVNTDGLPDMVFHFRFGDTGFSCADIPVGQKSVTLTGKLTGTANGNPIEGVDSLRLIGK